MTPIKHKANNRVYLIRAVTPERVLYDVEFPKGDHSSVLNCWMTPEGFRQYTGWSQST